MATEQSQTQITISPKAAEKIKEFMNEEDEKAKFLRVYVQGGGCSG
ncbi:MAG TPA: iron-sulfur cluster assembly accessory protein, partial [Nitrosopumilus sp.]|nr:iron-sulfur cluster assembly accessory protein [Nitrosopumilus sp.]